MPLSHAYVRVKYTIYRVGMDESLSRVLDGGRGLIEAAFA